MPEFAGFSTAVPMTGQLAIGAVTLFVAKIEKLKLGTLVKLNCAVADAPEPTICIEPGVMVIGKIGPVETNWFVALKLKLSIAIPWALPWLSSCCQTNQSAAFAGQLPMARLVTARLT